MSRHLTNETKVKVALLGLFLLVLPTSALAEGVRFTFSGGSANGSGLTLGNSASPSILNVVANPNGSGPVIGDGSSNLGSVTFTTGTWNNITHSFNQGGSIQIVSGGSFSSTGISNGSVLFSGSFSGPTQWTSTGNNAFLLSGNVTGNVLPALYALLNLPNMNPEQGVLVTLVINYQNGVGSIAGGYIQLHDLQRVPEPGTLTLFGTGLIAVGASLRRKLLKL